MGFKAFLNEAQFSTYDDLEVFLGLIKKDCQPFLKHKTQIFRGMGAGKYPDMGIRGVRADREPKDSSKSENIFINGFLRDNNLPLRSGVMFASTDEGTAMGFGDEFLVFPKGNFKCYYFDGIDDVYGRIFSNYRARQYFSTFDLVDMIEFHYTDLKKKYGEDIDILAKGSQWDYLAKYISKGMKVEDAVDKFMDFIEDAFTDYANDHGFTEELQGIPYHFNKFVTVPLGQFTVNDIAKSDGNELHIDCKEYYFCKTSVKDANNKLMNMKSVVEKELGLIER